MTEQLTALFEGIPLWETSLTAAWVAGVVFLLRLLLKKRAPRRVLCLLWLVVFARLLVPVKLESPVSLVPPALSQNASISVGAGQVSGPVQSGAHGAGQVSGPYDTVGGPSQAAGAPAGPSDAVNNPLPVVTAPALPENVPTPSVPETPAAFPWKALLAGIWLAGAAAMLGYGAVTWFRLRRRVRFAVRVTDRVWEDEAVASPFILGLFRPRIYLPSDLEGRARRLILCHEFAHLRRFDHIVKPLCWLALAIHWFNPAVWAAFLLLSRDMEGACDEAVLRSLGEGVKADYSYTLLALASGGRVPAPCPLAFDEGDAKGRIKSVLRYRRPALWIVVMSVLAVVIAAVCLLTNPVSVGPDTPIGPSGGSVGPDAPIGPTEMVEPSPTQSTGRDEGIAPYEAAPWMLEVLNGERTFSVYGTDRDIAHLKEAYYGDDQPGARVELGTLAILDLDGDGVNEMVISPAGDDEYLYSVVGYLILRQEGNTIRAEILGYRGFGSLKGDGTFSWSGSAFESGTGRLRFTDTLCETEKITWAENGSYFVEGRPATEEEFNAAIDAQNAKPEPVWYAFENGVLTVSDRSWKSIAWAKPYVPIPVDPAVNVSVPWFLDTDQQRLYQKAYSLYSHIFGASTESIDEWEWSGSEPLPPAEPVEVDGYTYTPSTGLFAKWDDLEAAALSVFTPGFWQARNTWLDDGGKPHQTFIYIDGRTYYLSAARGNDGTNPNFPNTFHLFEQTESEISFVLTGHYSERRPLPGESYEEADQRYADHWEEYIGYPMKLVLTEKGWRFDEFHCADTDNGLLPYANQAAPNPALYPDNPEPAGGACVHGLDHVYVDHLTDGRLVYRCMADFFPYYPPYPGAYSSESIGEGDYDGDGHIEEIITNSAGTLMLCDVVPLDGQPRYGGRYGEMKTCTLDMNTLIDGYPDADLSTAWIEPGDELILCVPLRDDSGDPTGTARWTLIYDGTSLSAGPKVG